MSNPDIGNESALLASIAVSLKRIADQMEKDDIGYEIRRIRKRMP